eukprot:190215-Pyramimonas_sp.AAC.1
MAPHWKSAALHFDGEGLQLGTGVFSLRRLLEQLSTASPGGPGLAGIVFNIAIGSAWARAREGSLNHDHQSNH